MSVFRFRIGEALRFRHQTSAIGVVASQYEARSGYVVVVLDRFEAGEMLQDMTYMVRSADGWVGYVYESELEALEVTP